MNREKARQLIEEVKENLISFAKKHNLELSVGRATFDDSTLNLKVAISETTPGGEVLSKERKNFTVYAKSIGLDPSYLDKEFSYRGKPYKIIGYLPQSYKFPILTKDYRGKQVKFPLETVRNLMKSVVPTNSDTWENECFDEIQQGDRVFHQEENSNQILSGTAVKRAVGGWLINDPTDPSGFSLVHEASNYLGHSPNKAMA